MPNDTQVDSTFREKVEPSVEPVAEGKQTTSTTITKVEPPYTSYEIEHGKPFTSDYFGLGETWNDPNGGFSKELSLIEEFVSDKISKGELPDNQKAVKEALKKMEKVSNLSEYDSPIKKIEVISAYVEFLMKCDKVNYNLKRYGHH